MELHDVWPRRDVASEGHGQTFRRFCRFPVCICFPVGADGERELVVARWGTPWPPQFGRQAATNIRNVQSPHWRRLGKGSRCIVPATSFCEYQDTKPRKTPIWGQGADLLETRGWDDLASGVIEASYS